MPGGQRESEPGVRPEPSERLRNCSRSKRRSEVYK